MVAFVKHSELSNSQIVLLGEMSKKQKKSQNTDVKWSTETQSELLFSLIFHEQNNICGEFFARILRF